MSLSAEQLLFWPNKECKIKCESSYYAMMLFYTVCIRLFLSTERKPPVGHSNMIDCTQNLKNNTVYCRNMATLVRTEIAFLFAEDTSE